MSDERKGIRESELERDLRNDSVSHADIQDQRQLHTMLMRGRWWAFGLGAIIVLVAGTRFWHYQTLVSEARANAVASEQVEVVKIVRTVFTNKVLLPAQIEALHEVKLQARVNGYVEEIHVDIGDRVTKGQILALLSTPELDAELTGAKAQLQLAEARSSLAANTENRIRQTLPGAVAEQERDQRQAEVKTSNADVSLAKARVAQYETLTQFKRVVAPFDGVIKSRLVDVGTLVSAGGGQATPLFEVVQDNPLRIFATVPENVIVQAGNSGIIESVDGAQTLDAKISRVAGALDGTTRTRRVEWDVNNQSHQWVPGMQAKVTLLSASRDAYSVPNTAVLFRAQGPVVAVVELHGTVHFVPVKVLEDNGKTLVIDGALSESATVVKSVAVGLQEGATLSIKSSGTVP